MDFRALIGTIQLNLIAMMAGTHLAVNQMRKRGAKGVIVNTSSTAAFGAMGPDPAYSTSKIGVVNFTQACKGLDERFGVRVMAVCPGIVDTAIVPREAEWLKPVLASIKMLQPEDIAKAVCDIILDDSKTGEYVIVQREQTAEA
jgi:NAD(P)-dependent dehydrogenase (short-subunit alcohol dehydrogenase family)